MSEGKRSAGGGRRNDGGLDMVTGGEPPRREPGSRRAERPPRKSWRPLLIGLLVLAVLVAGGWFAYGWVSDRFGSPEDYTGEGTGEVVIEVPSGSGWLQVSRILAEKDVVKSAEAFYQEALDDPEQSQIQAGSYQMREKMSAAAAYRALTTDIIKAELTITVPEGSRVTQIVERIVEATELTEQEVVAALEDPAAIGLPAVAGGNPEGYLYPATYTVAPGATAVDIVAQMVAKTQETTASLDIEARAADLGLNAEEVLTVASIVEKEVSRDEDRAKAARVIYNRLEDGMPLQMDSTVAYVSGREGDVFTTEAERSNPSAYNTYENAGLPPGPISSPGQAALEAALNPEPGDWVYFVAVDLETGETKFATTLGEHNKNVTELQAYCRESELC